MEATSKVDAIMHRQNLTALPLPKGGITSDKAVLKGVQEVKFLFAIVRESLTEALLDEDQNF